MHDSSALPFTKCSQQNVQPKCHQKFLKAQREQFQELHLSDGERTKQARIRSRRADVTVRRLFGKILQRIDRGLAVTHLIEENQILIKIYGFICVGFNVGNDLGWASPLRKNFDEIWPIAKIQFMDPAEFPRPEQLLNKIGFAGLTSAVN
ncbi:MAG: hypothetical protein OXG03_08340 [Gammaproteobacteria bacterium]|nr:hypothetical protein [Gammaproteobacteria bacterium]